ncbi:MAG: addiction module protein [Candidatus Sumerlaeota bacterium]|nr:addiction module protein [Candidatus Sumerlaeota bacterium]
MTKASGDKRAALAQQLIGSMDEIDEAEAERLCVEESLRRYQAYKQGRMTARPADEVFREIRARLK